jgi:uncharacterized protein YneR
MTRKIHLKSITLLLIALFALTGFQGKPKSDHLSRAKSTLKQILRLYDAGHDNLMNEFYPDKPGNKVTYLAGEDTITGKRVAYLWPTSGVFSAANSLLKTTGSKQYLNLIEKQILPGLEQYSDTTRSPACYQSYITSAGKSDRYYDDNVWLALDFCELYMMTGNQKYLGKSVRTWQFVISGWDDKLGGGIYWCEQKKRSKNTCSNAPASVLAFKLFEATRDSSYFKWGVAIYNWTKTTLQDTTDHLYFDNISIAGRVDTKKYTYNSGQMLQSAAMLYKLTGDKSYLNEAQRIAKSATDHFTEEFTTAEGNKMRLFRNTGTWFNSILLRGYTELYALDKNDEYLKIFGENMDHMWKQVRNKDGLFSKDWKGQKEDQYKSLLDQTGFVEMGAVL